MKAITVLGVLFVLHMATANKLVCHMTNWAQYRPGVAKFTPDNVDPFLCTHVIYGLVTINTFNQITPVEWNDEQHFAQLNNLKSINPQLKTLLSVGGNVNGLSPYISVVATAENRKAFINSALSYLRTHNFDGLNVVWDYPGHNGSPVSDKKSFTLLLSELDKAFQEEAKSNKKTQLLLSADVAAIQSTVEISYEVDQIALHLDFINVKTYDFHGSWERVTGHNSPLFHSPAHPDFDINYNINASIAHWLKEGAPSEKLLLGFPTYGRTFRLSTGANGLGAPANGPADAGPFTRTPGFWSYPELCSILPGAEQSWIPEQQVPFATVGSAWVGYDDQRSYSAKVQFMTGLNMGGAHVWTMDMDDFGGSFCGVGPYPLINHLRISMGFPAKPTTTPAPTTTPDPIAAFCRSRPDGLYPNDENKSTYFQCFQGNTYLHHCQPGLIYYDTCKCCDWP